MPAEPAPGQAAMEAWEVHWATAPRRGRGKPGYDEHADSVAGWEAAAAAVAAPLNAEIASLREQLATLRAEAETAAASLVTEAASQRSQRLPMLGTRLDAIASRLARAVNAREALEGGG